MTDTINISFSGTVKDCVRALGAIMLSLMVLAVAASAGCSCGAVGNWEATAQEFLSSGETGKASIAPSAQQTTSASTDSFPNGGILMAPKGASSSDLLIDVSDGEGYDASHAAGAIHLPSEALVDGSGWLKPAEELSRLLGEAGVSSDDSVIVYGRVPGEAEVAFFALRFLGHQDLRILDGGMDGWKEAGLPVETKERRRAESEYIPRIDGSLLADYGYVSSGEAQIVDVRPFVEFGKGRIPGSVALDPSTLLKDGRIKGAEELAGALGMVDKGRPVVVCSDEITRSAIAWLALELLGYDASIYPWEDWVSHQPGSAADQKEPASDTRYLRLGRI